MTDQIGSVIRQINAAGTTQSETAYSPYGEASTTGDDQSNNTEYTGRENDDTGLYFYRARYYDPAMKRFISEDPIGAAGGINMSAYVMGNPVGMNDAFGLDPMPKDWGLKDLLKVGKKVVCKIVEVATEANDWGQKARIEGEMNVWQRNIKMISDTLASEIEMCLMRPPSNQCKAKDDKDDRNECIEKASSKASAASRQEDDRHYKAMVDLLKTSTTQNAGGVFKEICEIL